MFDESMNDLVVKPLNARLLDGIRTNTLDAMDLDVPLPLLDVSTRPFTEISTVPVNLDLDAPSRLGLEFTSVSVCLELYFPGFYNQQSRTSDSSFQATSVPQLVRSFRQRYARLLCL